ncbi:MAG: hypothetical protein ACYC5Q_14805 [Thermoleophilia bacterium]
MSTEPFLRPRLTGARFEGGAIPLEFLKDFAVLQEMIVEVAKAEFLKDHPGRRRSPRGFTEGIELKLTSIEGGSAVPVISLDVAEVTLLPPQSKMYFDRAREAVTNAIAAAEENQTITDYLPEKTLGYFDRLGRSLRDGEAIEFPKADGRARARLTKETRRKLVLASSKVRELTEETLVRGTVPEADQDDMTFQVQLVDGRKVCAPIEAQHFDTIIEAFNGYKVGARVLLQGIGRFNRTERLLGFDSIEHMSMIEPTDIGARLEDLRSVKDGWLEGEGRGLSPDGLDWLAHAFDQRYSDDLPMPFLYPTEEGGIQAEWSLGANEITLEIDFSARTGNWHLLDIATDQDESRTLELDEDREWEWLVTRIEQIVGGTE